MKPPLPTQKINYAVVYPYAKKKKKNIYRYSHFLVYAIQILFFFNMPLKHNPKIIKNSEC